MILEQALEGSARAEAFVLRHRVRALEDENLALRAKVERAEMRIRSLTRHSPVWIDRTLTTPALDRHIADLNARTKGAT